MGIIFWGDTLYKHIEVGQRIITQLLCLRFDCSDQQSAC